MTDTARAPHRLAIRALLDGAAAGAPNGAAAPGAVERFLSAHAFPLVEGDHVTFVWTGEADAVRLRHFIYGLPTSQAFERVPGTDLWHLTLTLPHGSRIEYKIELERAGETQWIEDPRNPLRARDPFGANSVVHAHGYAVPEWTRPDPEARQGAVTAHSLASRALGRDSRFDVYLPARFRPTRRYPLLVVHDGSDYLRYAAASTVLDNLIHRLDVAETVVAFVRPGDRLTEYANSAAHARYLAVRRLLLIGRIDEAERRLGLVHPTPTLRTVHEMIVAGPAANRSTQLKGLSSSLKLMTPLLIWSLRTLSPSRYR